MCSGLGGNYSDKRGQGLPNVLSRFYDCGQSLPNRYTKANLWTTEPKDNNCGFMKPCGMLPNCNVLKKMRSMYCTVTLKQGMASL